MERQASGLAPVPTTALDPTKLFDNLYYFGFNSVGAWAVTTSDGIILLDTLNTTQEAEGVIEAGLRKVGLDSANVKYAIIGHGHFDHFGGAAYFQDKSRTRIAMGAPDWDLIERPNPNANPALASRPRPKRDILLTDGQQVTLGDTTITVMSTPGHTAGTLALLIPVRDKGKSLTVLMLSRANTTPNPVALASFEKALATAKQQKAMAVLNSHAGLFGDELGWMQAIRGNPAGRQSVRIHRGTLRAVPRHHDRVRPGAGRRPGRQLSASSGRKLPRSILPPPTHVRLRVRYVCRRHLS